MPSAELDFGAYPKLHGVRANFICDSSGHYKVDGSSRGLSSPDDRKLISHLRSITDAVIVGGETARAEQYRQSTRFETLVFTRHPETLPAGLKPLEFQDRDSLRELFWGLRGDHTSILIEAGPTLLRSFLEWRQVDQLCLTINGLERPAQAIAEELFQNPLGEPDLVQVVSASRYCIWNL